jgi:hypothetical protein
MVSDRDWLLNRGNSGLVFRKDSPEFHRMNLKIWAGKDSNLRRAKPAKFNDSSSSINMREQLEPAP